MTKITELELCKKFAELEGIELSDYPNDLTGNYETISAPYMSYNPITDLALNCTARDNHKVEVEYSGRLIGGQVSIGGSIKGMTYFSNKSGKPRAVIECILKSKGKI